MKIVIVTFFALLFTGTAIAQPPFGYPPQQRRWAPPMWQPNPFQSVPYQRVMPVQLNSPFDRIQPMVRVANLAGTWYMNGDPNRPTTIIQERLDGQALFINENGSEAWGQIQAGSVWIPDWSDGVNAGLQGSIRGDRIIWPTGTFWSRRPQ